MRSTVLGRALFVGAFLLVAGSMPACSCNSGGRRPGGGGSGGTGGGNGSDMQSPLSGALSITPADVTLDLVQGMPPPMQVFKVTIHDPSGDRDVTVGSSFALADPTLGTMSSNTFVAGTAHGGTTVLTASYTPPNGTQEQAQAMIHIRVKGTFPGPDCGASGCPPFPGDTAPGCPATVTVPKIVYPSDGVLLPPNMSVISVMWTPWPGTPPTIKAFEVAFKNTTTDVRVVTTCAMQTTDTTLVGGNLMPMPTGGCELQLTPAMWNFIAQSNRGGDAVSISIRATSDGTCATAASGPVNISFAEQDLNGALFYWKSIIAAGAGVGGQIFAKSFGDATPETQITGVKGTKLEFISCAGCHALSRDGSRMTVDTDDNDSDDEYSDVQSTLMDVAKKDSLDSLSGQPGFQAIAPDNKVYIGSDGLPSGGGNIWYMYDATNGMPLTPATVPFGPAMSRPTMPDFSPDAKSLLFVLPKTVPTWKGTTDPTLSDDDHIFGGSIYTASYDPVAKTFGTPTAVVASAGENNYYPSYSPDGNFIIFDRVLTQPGGTTCAAASQTGSCPNDSFSNPKARVWVLSTKPGAMPIDIELANGSPAATPKDVSNSWPRWTPFVQMYKGNPLLWVTFSSTRDYGLRVVNGKPGLAQCYPPDSYEDPNGDHGNTFPDNCKQPQLWMTAINLKTAEVMGAGDPSYPAFWLPYQDITTHNHTAQWTQVVAGQPMPDMGMCSANGANCAANGTCCSGNCLGTGVCGNPIP